MEEVKLQVKKRTALKKKARTPDEIPGVLYGRGFKNINVSVEYNIFEKVFRTAGESTFIDLTVDDSEPIKVLIHDLQRDPRSGKFIHIDFYKIKMDEKIHVNIAIHFEGVPPAEKELGGVLLTNLDEIEVKCLPKDLISSVTVDLTKLKTFEDVIHVSDLNIPEAIEVLQNKDEVVAKVVPPRTDKEIADLEAKPEADVEGVKAEGDEKAKEGEAEGDEAKKEGKKAEEKDSQQQEEAKAKKK